MRSLTRVVAAVVLVTSILVNGATGQSFDVDSVTPRPFVEGESCPIREISDLPPEIQERLSQYAQIAGEPQEIFFEEFKAYAEKNSLDISDFIDCIVTMPGYESLEGKNQPDPRPGPAPQPPPDGTMKLPKGQKGDIYFTKLGLPVVQNIGHVGLYSSVSTVIEAGKAKGIPPRVYQESTRKIMVDKQGFQRKYLKIGPKGPKHIKAIDEAMMRAHIWARSRRPYNYHADDNKHVDGRMPGYQFNCSQLVWSAYIPHVNLDIDPGVVTTDSATWPYELIRHSWLQSY